MIRTYDDATHVAVPIEPTGEMLDAVGPKPKHWDKTESGKLLRLSCDQMRISEYKQMIAAAPQPQEQSEPVAWRWRYGPYEQQEMLDNSWRFSSVPLAGYMDREIQNLYLAQPDLAARVAELQEEVEALNAISAIEFATHEAYMQKSEATIAQQEKQIMVAQIYLNELSRLGNGDEPGNSDGNVLAQEALAKIGGAS